MWTVTGYRWTYSPYQSLGLRVSSCWAWRGVCIHPMRYMHSSAGHAMMMVL